MENSINNLSDKQAHDNKLSWGEEIQDELGDTFSEVLTQEVRLLNLSDITVNLDLTCISEHKISELCDSIEAVGLLQPIIVSQTYELVVGRHRFLAFRKLGLSQIPSFIVHFGALRQQIAELDENLVRRNMSVLERGLALKKRNDLYGILHPETRRGCYERSKTAKFDAIEKRKGFTRMVSAECDISPRTAQRLIQIANKLDEEASGLIKNHRIANKQTDLARLSQLNRQSQIAIAKLLVEKKLPSIDKAIEQLSEIDRDLLEELNPKRSQHEVTKKQKSTSNITRLAKFLALLINETKSLQTEEVNQILAMTNLPQQTIEDWLKTLLTIVNPEFTDLLSQPGKTLFEERLKKDEKSKMPSNPFSLPLI